MQRLSQEGVGYKLMILEAVSTLTSKVEGEDIVWTMRKRIDAGNAAGMVLRTILNISWGDFQQFFKILMQKVTHFNKPVIITAHLKDELDQKAMEMKTFVPIKGALKNNGIEAYFSTVLCAKKVDITVLADYKNPLLTITEEEQLLGYKHVFQTKPTKTSVGLRIRSPMGMFDKEHTYIDNDAQTVIDYLTAYYN